MQGATLSDRIVGAARLDVATYENVERDTTALPQALLVVVLGAIASGVGSLGVNGVLGFVGGIIGALVGWAVYAGIAYFVGVKLFALPETHSSWEELLRTLGFAQAPRLLLVLAWIPILGAIIALIVAIWVLITTIVAIRQSLDFTTGRAIGTAVIAWLALAIIQGVLSIVL